MFHLKKARRAMAAQMRDDHPVTRRRQQWGGIDKSALPERIRALSEALMETEV